MEQTIRTAHSQSIKAFLNPIAMLGNLWLHRDLAWQMAERDIEGRYRTARLGLLWSILTPLALLVAYTFVFSVVWGLKWNQADASETHSDFALNIFCAILLYNLFAEVVNRAPTMVVGNPNYVKKVVFPLEIFVVSGIISSLINMLIGYCVWLIGWALVQQSYPHWTIVFFPVVIFPVCLFTAGLAWILASVGVFVRDLAHAVMIVTQMLFFATPIFYRIDQVPEPYLRILKLSPLTHAIEDMRSVLIGGEFPDMCRWLIIVGISAVLALLGYAFFMKSKRAFGDVV